MANRRPMGGPQRGNRSFSQHHPFQGNSVSPWQGNMPSNSFNQGGGGGLLNQLASNPQQLALALTNLLQPQQQQMSHNPPSLLSLNTSPAFSQDRDSFSRFGNRGRSDFRRNEPYNKNRSGNWRSNDSRPGNRGRDGNKGGQQNRKPSQQKGGKDKAETKGKTEENGSADTTANSNLDDTREGDGADTKKWKEDKHSADDKKDEEGDDDVEKKDDEGKDGKYHGVPQKLLHCFVCNKDMWDGESFQKHVRGRAHKQMLQSVEESFHITVNIMRENMRLSEEKKVIELLRMHRLNKNKYNRKFQEPESHCNMCDLKFLGKIISHRKTEGHQRLKRFLHPNCDICAKEFPSRMDWVDHRLTPEHLRQLAENLEKKAGDEDGDIIVEESLEADLEPLLEESMEMEEDNPILELTDDLNNLQNRIPAYKKSRGISKESLKPFTGFMCEICHRSFENEQLSQAHLRTEQHYYSFIDAAKTKFKKQQEEKEAAEAESRKRKREEEEAAAAAGKENDKTKDGDEEDEKEGDDTKGEMYDPEEATNDDGENEKSENEASKNEMEEESALVEAIAASQPAKNVTKVEEQEAAATTAPISPRTRRGGAVKNGAGPKSKKQRK